jgi:hypothetical protein
MGLERCSPIARERPLQSVPQDHRTLTEARVGKGIEYPEVRGQEIGS